MLLAAIFDVDGVLVRGNLGLDFVEYLYKKGIFPREYYTLIERTKKQYFKKTIKYEKVIDILTEQWASGIRGLDEDTILSHAEEFIQQYIEYVPYTDKIIALFKKKGYLTIAMSVSPVEVLRAFGGKFGLNEVCGTIAKIDNGKYIGKRENKIWEERGKLNELLRIAKEKHIDLQKSYAFGDTTHDIPMLSLVGNPILVGIAISDDLLKEAKKKRWRTYTNPAKLYEDLEKEL